MPRGFFPNREIFARGHSPTTWAVLSIVSPRFLATLEDAGLTGWTTYSVEIEEAVTLELEGYAGLAVAGRAGPIEADRGQPTIVPPKAPGGNSSLAIRGSCFDPESWDGSDLFIPEGTVMFGLSPRAHIALTEAGLTNLQLNCMAEDVWRPID